MERYAFLTRIKPEQRDRYIAAHREVWPELLTSYRRAGLRNLSCFLLGDVLLLYVESENYETAEAALVNDPIDLSWQKLIGPMQDPSGFQAMIEVFHMD